MLRNLIILFLSVFSGWASTQEESCCQCYYLNENKDPADDRRFLTRCRSWYNTSKACQKTKNPPPKAISDKIVDDPVKLEQALGFSIDLKKEKDKIVSTSEQSCPKRYFHVEGHGDRSSGEAFQQAIINMCVKSTCDCPSSCNDFVFSHGGCQTMPLSSKDSYRKKMQEHVDRLVSSGRMPAGLTITLVGNQASSYVLPQFPIDATDTPFKYELYSDEHGRCEIEDRVDHCTRYFKVPNSFCSYDNDESPPVIECKKSIHERKRLKCQGREYDSFNDTNVGEWVYEENYKDIALRSTAGETFSGLGTQNPPTQNDAKKDDKKKSHSRKP